MRSIKQLILGSLVILTGTAQAEIIDFVKLTEDAGALGESAWDPLEISGTGFNLSITATQFNVMKQVDETAYAYLDNNHAGLGVCGHVDASDINVARPGDFSNICNPSSDDNVTDGETLYFEFDTAVTIEKIWFNNTHDEDFEIISPDEVTIDGMDYLGPGNGYAPTSAVYNTAGLKASESNFLGPFSVAADTPFSIAFKDQQFYISGMEAVVPEPGTLALLGSGLLGIGLFRRRRQG